LGAKVATVTAAEFEVKVIYPVVLALLDTALTLEYELTELAAVVPVKVTLSEVSTPETMPLIKTV
jgi:hypothetical protein